MNEQSPRVGAKTSSASHSTSGVGQYAVGAAAFVLLLTPIVVFALYAFSTQWFYPQIIPNTWTLEPLARQLTDPHVQDALLQSVWIAVVVTGLSLLIAYPAARALGTREFAGKGLVIMFLFLPTIVPPVAIGMGLNIVMLRAGLAGTGAAVILVHLIPVLPYTVFVLAGVFARYDENYEHQATALGASRTRVLLHVTLPLVWPGLAVAALFAFLISWSQYLLTLLVGSGQVITLPLLLFSAVSGGNPSTIAVLSLLFAVPPFIAIALTARYLSRSQLEEGAQY
jgi:putative spermidine/putrescine transport system permease protein